MVSRVYSRWKETGLLKRVENKKRLFYEEKKSIIGEMLNEYSRHINGPYENGQNGAIILAVVGGKLSEGINFSDNLGRLVLMVGLPFPNLKSQELQERIAFYENLCKQQGKPIDNYSENICMKAVNQSIGRAIRHKDDYAAVLLVDSRYKQQRIQSKLPKWMCMDIKVSNPFSETFGELKKVI